MSKPRIALALGSGGLRGIAHVGVLRALAEAEIQPTVYAGSSAGALVAAAAEHDLSLSEMESIVARLHRKSLFRIDLLGLLRYGMGALSLYRSAPLRELCVELFGTSTFQDLRTPLVVSTVDGGGCGICLLRDARAPAAGLVGGRLCMDGGVLDPLALQAVAPLADLVIAVVLEGSAPGRATTTMAAAPTIWWQAQAMVTRDLGRYTLAYWDGPPLIVIRPEVHDAHPIRGGGSGAADRGRVCCGPKGPSAMGRPQRVDGRCAPQPVTGAEQPARRVTKCRQILTQGVRP